LTVYLLDVNVLIALLVPAHATGLSASRWFESIRDDGWATCPIVENGVLRIMSSPGFPDLSTNPVDHAGELGELCRSGQHQFWSDDISIRDIAVDGASMTAAQITDLYLLALASTHGGKFATFDQRIPAHVIPGGVDALELISL
jgi:predicted nucleic acid-binding protein